jgi:hypothetical protein
MFNVSLLDKGFCEKKMGLLTVGQSVRVSKSRRPPFTYISIQAFGLVPSTHPSCVSS